MASAQGRSDQGSFTVTAAQVVFAAAITLAGSTLAGITGFGAGLLLLPVLVAFIGVKLAIPVLAIVQVASNGGRVWVNRHDVNWRIAAFFAGGAIPCALVASYFFHQAPHRGLQIALGVFLLLTPFIRRGLKKLKQFHDSSFAFLGGGAAILSSFLGVIGPILSPFFLGAGLVRGAYVGTDALCSVAIHGSKVIGYATGKSITLGLALFGMLLAPLAVLGAAFGKKILHMMTDRHFEILMDAMLMGFGLWFIIKG